ncbi:hypothetical protein EDB86DRAFT_3105794 [Lactarius hatsudake]|nr:hypothetical protein EDB86DRAFT_3105794 [Lactarius hatsudake]
MSLLSSTAAAPSPATYRPEHPQRHRRRPSPMASFLLDSIAVLLCTVLLLPEATHALSSQPRNPQTDPRRGPQCPHLIVTAERTRILPFSYTLGRLVVSRGADGLPAARHAKALSGLTLRLGSTSGAPGPFATEATLPLGSRINLTLSNDTIALVWISSDDATAVAAEGFRFTHAGPIHSTWTAGLVDGWENTLEATAGASLSRPGRTPTPSTRSRTLTAAQAPLVLGGQQLLWTEQSGPQNLDSIVWPRTAASVEVFWSGPGGNVSAALPRLHELGYRFRNRGFQTIALRPFACDLTV